MYASRLFLSTAALLTCAGLVSGVGRAAAATSFVNFETPALADGATVSTQFNGLSFQPLASSFRPKVKLDAGLSRSASRSLDITYSPGEFPTAGFDALLTLGKASAFSVYARSVNAMVPPRMRLRAFDAIGVQLASDPANGYRDVTGTYGLFQVSSGVGNYAISRVAMDMDPSDSGYINIDDATFDRSDAPISADFAVSLNGGQSTRTAIRGQTIDVPLTITRLDGSDGNVTMSIGNLPAGVGADFSPNPVPATGGSTTLTLTATAGAPLAAAAPITVTGTPASAAVGPGPRQLTPQLKLGVADAYTVTSSHGAPLDLRPCESASYELAIVRDASFSDSIVFAASAGDGVAATVSPVVLDAVGPQAVTVTVRRVDARGPEPPAPATSRNLVVTATSAGAARTIDTKTINFAPPQYVSADLPNEPFGPRPFLPPKVVGWGFCDGAKLRALDSGFVYDAVIRTQSGLQTIEGSLDFARDFGPEGRPHSDASIEVLQPGTNPQNLTTPVLPSTSFREQNAFSFDDRADVGGIGLPGWAELMGYGDVYIDIGFADVPRPDFLLLQYVWADPLLSNSDDEDLGWSLATRKLTVPALQERLVWREHYSSVPRYEDPHVFSSGERLRSQVLQDRSVLGERTFSLSTYLNIEHAAEFSAEYLDDWFLQQFTVGPYIGPALLPLGIVDDRSRDATDTTFQRIADTVESGAYPLIYLNPDNVPGSKVVIAYDYQRTPGGDAVVWILDPRDPWTDHEDASYLGHHDRVLSGRIIIDDHGHWTWTPRGDTVVTAPSGGNPATVVEYPRTPWKGRIGVSGQFLVQKYNGLLDGDLDPLIEGSVTALISYLADALSGSPRAAAAATTGTGLRSYVPPGSKEGIPSILVGNPHRRLTATLKANRQGKLAGYLVGGGGGASVTATTSPGAATRLAAVKGRHGFDLAPPRRLSHVVLSAADSSPRSARVAQVSAGALTGRVHLGLSHRAKTLTFKGNGVIQVGFTGASPRGVGSFKSAPLRMRDGESVVVAPSWKHPDAAYVTAVVHGRRGARRVRLRNTIRKPVLRITRAAVARANGRATVKLTARISGKLDAARLAVQAEALRGSQVLAHDATQVRLRGAGRRAVSLSIPLDAATRTAKGLKVRITAAVLNGEVTITMTKRAITKVLR